MAMWVPYFLLLVIILLFAWLSRSLRPQIKPWLYWPVLIFAAVLVTNTLLAIFSSNVGTGISGTSSVQSFRLVNGPVEVWGMGSGGDDGPATIAVIRPDTRHGYQFSSRFNYDLLNSTDPGSAHYSFSNFDPFVDLVVHTVDSSYVFSGWSGELLRRSAY